MTEQSRVNSSRVTYQDWVDEEIFLFGLALSLRGVPFNLSYRPEVRREIWDRAGAKVKTLLAGLTDGLRAMPTSDWSPYELSQKEALLRQTSELLEEAQRNWLSP